MYLGNLRGLAATPPPCQNRLHPLPLATSIKSTSPAVARQEHRDHVAWPGHAPAHSGELAQLPLPVKPDKHATTEAVHLAGSSVAASWNRLRPADGWHRSCQEPQQVLCQGPALQLLHCEAVVVPDLSRTGELPDDQERPVVAAPDRQTYKAIALDLADEHLLGLLPHGRWIFPFVQQSSGELVHHHR